MPQSKKVESSLSDELNESAELSVRHRMYQILDSLGEEERKALEKVLEKMYQKNNDESSRSVPRFSYKWLADTLTKHGYPIKKNQIRHYMVFLYPKDREQK